VLKFKKYLEERYVNAIGTRDLDVKNQYKKQVWDLLQKSYAGIGGLKGNGFQDMETMVAKIPMWKMAVNNGTVEAVVLYKDKGGRKSVAMGCSGSPYAKKTVADMMKNELKRSYGEKSKAALGTMMKMHPWDVLEPFVQKPDAVAKIAAGDTITPLSKHKGPLPKDAQMTLSKYPQLKDYGYMRDIAGQPTFKVMIGSPGKSIR
jgi:hypothetical protein